VERNTLSPVASVRAPEDVILSIEDVGRSFGGLRAVDGVSFKVKAGQIKSLIGPNGAGKTTLLNLVSGVLAPNQGRITFDGRDVTGAPPHQVARFGLQRTFQHERLFTHLTVLENVMIGCEHGADGSLRELGCSVFACGAGLDAEMRARGAAAHWLDVVGLRDRVDETVGSLPHGQRKLVELARAAAAGPTLLLLDETAAGLNDAEKVQFKALIRRFRESGVAILLIEHDTDFVMELSDEIVVMNFGRLIADGSPEAVRRDEAVLAAYLGG
jgi:branched-chain amino acid transport system ATP-binding protein